MIKKIVYGFCLMALPLCSSGQAIDSLDIKIGQMLIIGFGGPTVDQNVLKEVAAGKVGSIILFEKNIPAKNSFVALKKITWTYHHAAPIPLFIAIDQEGGKVNRLKDKYGFPKSITAEAMGKAGTLDSVRFYGEATAATLAGLGINVNFAPDIDLRSNPNNPVIAKPGRSFSNDEDSVALLAKEFIEAHRKMGVITVLKHFPGHGSSKSDSHLGMADVTNTWERRELKPYETLINSGTVDGIMTAHIVNKKLDPSGNPGTLSTPMLKGMLRDSLHYNGVIFSDDMQMHAITEHYGLEDAIRLAITAGVDIMCFSNNITGSDTRTVEAVHSIIKNFIKKGILTEARIDESFRRIMLLKSRLEKDQPVYRPDVACYKTLADAQAQVKTMQDAIDNLKKQNEELLKTQSKKKRKKGKG